MSSDSDNEFSVRSERERKRKSKRHVSSSDDERVQSKPSKKKKTKKKPSKKEELIEMLRSHSNRKPKPACNIVNYMRHQEMNFTTPKFRNPSKDIIIKYCKTLKIHKMESPFDRRVTFMIWHPTNPRLLAVASHWGEVILYDHEKHVETAPLIVGIGPGGSIQGMQFDPLNSAQIYAASMEGKFMVINFETKKSKSFIQTNDINRWFISVDVNLANNTVVAGDTKGAISILSAKGEVIFDRLQIHKKTFKVSHIEFSKKEPWLLCTSSTDSTIKLWDIRSLRMDKFKEVEPLQSIEHEKPVNAAYFSLKDGSKLLTTDQHDKIYIYRAPLWDLETCIMHPHRQFQHLTPIKAYWHPFENIVFIGRYPHDEFPGYHSGELRTIDFFDADSGELLYQHYQTGCNGILCLNRFNITGDVLASSYGSRFVIWKPNVRAMQELSEKENRVENKENGETRESESKDEDWEAFIKKQTKEKSVTRKKLKIKTKVGANNDEKDES